MKKTEYVTAILDIQNRWGRAKRVEKHKLCSKLRSHGVKHLRFFLWAVWGKQKKWSQMFLKNEDGKFQIFKTPGLPQSGMNWNPEFWDNLKDLGDVLATWRIAPYVDFGDHCGTNKGLRNKHPLYNNVDGINGMYDVGWKAQAMWAAIISKVVDMYGVGRVAIPTKLGKWRLGPKVWYGLGNELYCTYADRHKFGELWAYPKAHSLRTVHGYRGPILFSAYPEAAHAIRGYVSTEGNWKSEFKPKDTVRVFHGIDLWEDFVQFVYPANDSLKAGRGWAVSDDGTNCKDPLRKAICVNVGRYCSANIRSVVVFMKNVKLYMETVGASRSYFHHMEMLPRSVSEEYQSFGNINDDRDLDVYKIVAKRVFDMKIAWKIPKWMLKKYLK